MSDCIHPLVERYSIPSYAGRLTLFRAAEQPDWPGTSTDDSALGWAELVKGSIRVRRIPGSHLEIFRNENLKQLATEPRARLEETWPDCGDSGWGS